MLTIHFGPRGCNCCQNKVIQCFLAKVREISKSDFVYKFATYNKNDSTEAETLEIS
jgi:hypothetical protein